MAQRDVTQLLLQVDASVALAQRNIRSLSQTVSQETGKIDASLASVEKAHARMGQSFSGNGRFRSGLQQLSFQIGDVSQQMALGTRASIIFAQQSGQVIQALQIMGGEGNAFLRFLGGPWGAVLASAAVVLGAFGGKLFETKDKVGELVEKMREQAKQAADNRAADELWKTTIEGLTEAIRKRREEQEKGRLSDVGAERESFREAKGEITGQGKNLDDQVKQLTEAIARVKSLRAQIKAAAGDPRAAGVLEGELAAAEGRRDLLVKTVREVMKSIADAQKNARVIQSGILTREAEGALDPLKAESDRISLAIDELNKKFDEGQIAPKAYRSEIERLTKALKDAQEAASSRKAGVDADLTNFVSPVAGGSTTGKFGESRPGHTHAGVDIAVPVGTAVKAPADGVVIEAGTLPGYGNVIYIDHGRGTITRLAHLSNIGVTKGQRVEQGDLVGLSGGAKGAPGSGDSTGPHLHYEVRRGGRAVDPRKGVFPTDSAAAGQGSVRSAESDAAKAVRQQNAFEEQRDRLNQELLAAQGELVQGIDQQAAIAEAQILVDESRRNSALQNDVEEKNLTQLQADELKGVNHAIALQKIANIERQKQVRLLQQQDQDAEQSSQFQVEALQYQDEIARTQDEHRRLQLQILDLVYQEKEAHLERLKLIAEGNGDLAEANRLQQQIDHLPEEKSRDQGRVVQGTMNPLEAWAKSVPQDAAQITEALQDITAHGLDSLSDGITEVIMGTKSLGAAFKDIARSIIADIIKMTIRMLIFRAISGIIGGSSSLPDLQFAKGGVFSGGNVIPFASGGVVNASTIFPMAGGRIGLMGEAGPEAVMPLARDGRGRLGVRLNDTGVPQASRAGIPANAGSGGPIEMIIGFAPSPEFMPIVQSISAQTVGRAAPIIIKTAVNQTMRAAARPKLMGRG